MIFTKEQSLKSKSSFTAIATPCTTYTLPPGTPKDRVQLFRKAFDATLKDAEFRADAKKSRLNVEPVLAEDIEKVILGLFKLDPTLVAKLMMFFTTSIIVDIERRTLSRGILKEADYYGND
jgi:hypothetical protein